MKALADQVFGFYIPTVTIIFKKTLDKAAILMLIYI